MRDAHALVPVILDLFMRAGYPFAQDDREAMRARLNWEWESGQWVLLADPASQRLWAWQSWYRTSYDLLDKLRTGDVEEQARRSSADADLVAGPCCYIATTVVAPWAPRGTYRRIFELLCEQNADAEVVVTHLVKRDGRRRWMQRRLH